MQACAADTQEKEIIRGYINHYAKNMHDKHGRLIFKTLNDGCIEHEKRLHSMMSNVTTVSFNREHGTVAEIKSKLRHELKDVYKTRAFSEVADINHHLIASSYASKEATPTYIWFDYPSFISDGTNPNKTTWGSFIDAVGIASRFDSVSNSEFAVTFSCHPRCLRERFKSFFGNDAYQRCSYPHVTDYSKTTGRCKAEEIARFQVETMNKEFRKQGWRCKQSFFYQNGRSYMMTACFDRENLAPNKKIKILN